MDAGGPCEKNAPHKNVQTIGADYVQRRAERHSSDRSGIGGSVLSTAVAGLAFATLTVWTNSLLPALALHWAINGFGYLAGWYLSRKSPQLP